MRYYAHVYRTRVTLSNTLSSFSEYANGELADDPPVQALSVPLLGDRPGSGLMRA